MISTRGRYALRVMIDLAEHWEEGFIPMKDVAARQGISLKYLEQILPSLTKNGLLETASGKGGGYRLKKAPQDCSAGEILRITEGNLCSVACLLPDAETCEREKICSTVRFWKGLDDVVNEYLDHFTLADFLRTAPSGN